jgi:hypothetical protein
MGRALLLHQIEQRPAAVRRSAARRATVCVADVIQFSHKIG